MAPSFSGLPGTARRGRPPRRGGHQWLRLLAVLIILLAIIYVGLNPWALHIGGRFTPLEEWTGYGPVRGSNGGQYVLLIQLRGGMDLPGSGHSGGGNCENSGGCDNVSGTARLCTESGADYHFSLGGGVHAWLSTGDARTTLVLDDGQTKLPFPVYLAGRWHGPVLRVASTDDAFTEVFTPRGAIRTVTSTADDGTAQARLQFGSVARFEAACRRLAG
jgi:hypothetical protein